MAESIAYIRSSVDAEKFYAGLAELMAAAFPERLQSIYLLSSRADGSAIATSDVDLALVFHGAIDPAERPRIKAVLDALQRVSPVMLDATITSDAELARGITTSLQNHRLLSGPDVLKDKPLKPKGEMLLYYAGFAFHFVCAIRKGHEGLRYPLQFPGEPTGYCGYEVKGTRISDGGYTRGLNLLGTLVSSIASFRLAARANVFSPGKSRTLGLYRQHLPHDAWLPMLEELHALIRTKLGGKIPPPGEDEARLFHWCPQVLTLENEFVGDVIMSIEQWLPIEEPAFQAQLVQFVSGLQCTSPAHLAKLGELKARLGLAK